MNNFFILLFIILLIILFFIINKNKVELNYEYYPFNEYYSAIIIEPREHKALEFVLNNFIENLSNQWIFIIFHGNQNINYIYNILNNSPNIYKNKDRIKLVNLNVDNLSINDYNNLLVSKYLYTQIPTELFLIFQTDTILCKENKDLIYKFLKFDYVGSPLKCKLVGNGGLSLRRKSKMLEILDNCEYKKEPEDVYFSLGCDNINIYKPSFEEAKEFGVEGIYNDNSFGIHKPWIHLSKKKVNKKNNYCTGLNKLKELNN